MSLLRKLQIILCAGMLLAGCRPHTSGARLSEAEAIRIAGHAATNQAYRLEEYDAPRAHYEFTRKDKTWTVFYDGKVRRPGHHFQVWVDDRTGEAKVMAGE